MAHHYHPHPMLARLIDYKDRGKNPSTWFPIEYDKKGAVVFVGSHVNPHFKVTGTSVGRFTCSEPIFQTLPPVLRRFIKPRDPSLRLVRFDYRQIENRCVAWHAQDTQMLRDFKAGMDIYTIVTA